MGNAEQREIGDDESRSAEGDDTTRAAGPMTGTPTLPAGPLCELMFALGADERGAVTWYPAFAFASREVRRQCARVGCDSPRDWRAWPLLCVGRLCYGGLSTRDTPDRSRTGPLAAPWPRLARRPQSPPLARCLGCSLRRMR